jgi:hypothetical protein
MKRFVLSIMVLSLALAFSRTPAFAQAAAESVLLNANSAATTAKAGSALGSALNRVNRQLGGQVQEVTHPEVGMTSQRAPQSAQTNRALVTPATGNLITSINGAASPSCVSSVPPSTSDKTSALPAPTNCTSNSSREPETQRYKSVVTVSFPK